jgi:hypothetical protein
MKKLVVAAIAICCMGAGGEPLSTERYIAGTITQVSPSAVTITSAQKTVTGKIDPKSTRITINQQPAKLADLKLTAHASAELCLDDSWVSIDVHPEQR